MRTCFGRAAARVPTALTKREREAMDYATVCAYDAHAFSISFDITARRVKALIYFEQPKHMEQNEMHRHDVDKENVQHASTTAQGPRTTSAPAKRPPAAPRRSQECVPKKPAQKQAQKQAPRCKQSKVDRNALSACSTGNLLSEAALAAQARVDASKEPQHKRRRLAREPSPEPSLPCRGSCADSRSDSGLDDDGVDEPTLGAPLNVLSSGDPRGFFATKADATAYLERNGYTLWEDEVTGALAGYNGSGEHVGKWSDGTEAAELPAAVIVAYMMTNDPGWQRVERKTKGKRDRGARDQCVHS